MPLQLVGCTYEVRDQLKQLGCFFDAELKEWFAPEKVHAEAQALALSEAVTWPKWQEYLGTLVWAEGSFTETVWNAALRAASLAIPYGRAWQEIAGRVRAEKSVGDRWFDRNISRAYESVSPPAGVAWSPSRAPSKASEPVEKPTFRNQVLDRVAAPVAEEIGQAWLADRSPVDPGGVTAGDFLGALYEPGERVVVFEKFESQGQWLWDAEGGFVPSTVLPASLYEQKAVPLDRGGPAFAPRGQDGIWYLCNPVTGDWRWMEEVSSGDDPHWSRRFHECVTSWRYLVLESDKARGREWLAMAVQLPLRIAAIYTSGGKSIHVLVRMDAKSKAQWDEWRDAMKPVVVTLGADKGCLSAVRLTRLPDCFRASKGREQRLLYLNPSPDMTPIVSRPVLRDAVGAWERLGESLAATDPMELDHALAVECALRLEHYRRDELAAQVKAAIRKAVE